MFSLTSRKNIFIEIGSELVCWMILRGTKTDASAEKGREEFLESLNSSHAMLEKKTLFGSSDFLIKLRQKLDKGI